MMLQVGKEMIERDMKNVQNMGRAWRRPTLQRKN